MSDIADRLDRLESFVEQQQETVERQRERIDAQQETIEHQRDRLEQQAAVIDELRAGDETTGGGDPGDGASISRRGAMKTAGLVGLLGASAGAATAGPTIGEPGNQVETLYTQGLAGDLTGGTAVTDLVGAGLTVNDGSLDPALSSDLTLSNGDIAVDVGPSDVGAAPDSHGNEAHSSEFATSGEVPTSPGDIGAASDSHGNDAHSETYAVDGDAQPPETHGNAAHSTNFATSSDVPTSPGDIGAASNNHGNEAHSSTFATSGEVPDSPGDIGAASNSHGNGAHSETFAVDGVAQPPEDHGNAAHTESFAVDGDAQPPETHGNGAHSSDFATSSDVPSSPSDIGAASNNHGNEAHSSTFATSGEVPSSPGDIGAASDNHGNEAHSSTFATSGEVPDSPGDIGAASNSHGNGAHNTNFISSLSGGAGINQGSIGNDDTISVDWSDANDLDGSGNVQSSVPAVWSSGNNNLSAGDDNSAVLSGTNNSVSGSGECVITGGEDNNIDTCFRCIIGAGIGNSIDTNFTNHAGILAGSFNSITGSDFPDKSIICGGRQNTISGANEAFIGAGEDNTVSGNEGGVITGEGEEISALGTIVGGHQNSVEGAMAGVLNGSDNTAAGVYATVPGGANNDVRGAFSLAFGNNATVETDGTVAFADASDAEFAPDDTGLHTQMAAYAPEVNRAIPERRRDRTNTESVDSDTALNNLVEVGVRTDEDGLVIDPEGFNEAFDLDGETLGTLDVDAALVGAVQALAAEVERLRQDAETARNTQ